MEMHTETGHTCEYDLHDAGFRGVVIWAGPECEVSIVYDR